MRPAFLDPDYWTEMVSTLCANRTRTGLTMFGVFWGMFMLVMLLGSGNGLEQGVSQSFRGMATNSASLAARSTDRAYAGLNAGRKIQLTRDDAVAIRARIGGIEHLAAQARLGERTLAQIDRRQGRFHVYGQEPEFRHILELKVAQGRFLDPLDLAQHRKVAVIGSEVARRLCASGAPVIGTWLELRGSWFRVVGTFQSLRQGDQAAADENSIYLPLTTFQEVFNWGDRIGQLLYTAPARESVAELERRVTALVRARHRIHPEDQRALQATNLAADFAEIQALFRGIRIFVWIVGTGTLLAGVIGVSNIMLISVRERTREFGIRKALGATPGSMVSLVLREAVALTASAGGLGLVLGIALLAGVDQALQILGGTEGMFEHPQVAASSALAALALLIGSGCLAGVLPALRAVAIQPVEAMRA